MRKTIKTARTTPTEAPVRERSADSRRNWRKTAERGAPVSVKLVNGREVETCLNPGCPYVKAEGEGGETPLEH